MSQGLHSIDIRWGESERIVQRPIGGANVRTASSTKHLVAVQDRSYPRAFVALLKVDSDFPLDPQHQIIRSELVLYLGAGSTTLEMVIPVANPYLGTPVLFNTPFLPASTINGFYRLETEVTSAGTEVWTFNVTLLVSPLVDIPSLEERGYS